MNILHTVEFYYPSVGGMQEVVKQLSERLIKLGHHVTVATSQMPERTNTVNNGVTIKEFALSGNDVRGFQGDTKEYQNFLINSKFDIVVNFGAQQWASDLSFPILDQITAKKIFVPTGFSALNDKKYKNYFSKMPQWMGKYDMNIFLSDNYRDINFARNHGIKKTILIPNGADEDEFSKKSDGSLRKKLNISKDDSLILTIGSHSGIKGHAEAMKIFDMANIQNATLLIIGNVFGKGCSKKCLRTAEKINKKISARKTGKQILIRELTREDTVRAYQESDLFLFTSNVECSPIVLFEAMAAGLPFLTTKVGNAEEIIQWSRGGMLLPTIPMAITAHPAMKYIPVIKKHLNTYDAVTADIKPSVKLFEKIMKDKNLRSRLAENGHTSWKKNFTWEKITKKYENLYLSLVSR